MSDCRFGVSPVNYPDPDPESEDIRVTSLGRVRSNYLTKQLRSVISTTLIYTVDLGRPQLECMLIFFLS